MGYGTIIHSAGVVPVYNRYTRRIGGKQMKLYDPDSTMWAHSVWFPERPLTERETTPGRIIAGFACLCAVLVVILFIGMAW
jgi:hypothetical protein